MTLRPLDVRPRRALRHLLPFLVLPALLAQPLWADEGGAEPPEWLPLLDHGDIDVDPGWRFDSGLQKQLEAAVGRLGQSDLAAHGKLGIALVDLGADPPRLAEINGTETVYAASVPKIGVLYAAFQARKEGRLVIDDTFRETLTDMCRYSSNRAASQAIHALGFGYINSVLWQSGLYNPDLGGGLWVGKGYGGPDDYWHRDPVADKSHAANPVALARLLTLLAEDRLVDAPASAEMREILGNPGIHHKFVRGLDCRPGSTICRKSGTWSLWHGDAALVERGDKKYVAVALCETPQGPSLLESLIVALDDCVPEHVPSVPVAQLPPAPPARVLKAGTAPSRRATSF